MKKECRHFFVTGKVQGVFFRDSTQRKAKELSIVGWVRNLDDGRVEVLACGTKESLMELSTWLKQGPPTAKVIDVVEEDWEFFETDRFEVR